jgi:hypothetical protein
MGMFVTTYLSICVFGFILSGLCMCVDFVSHAPLSWPVAQMLEEVVLDSVFVEIGNTLPVSNPDCLERERLRAEKQASVQAVAMVIRSAGSLAAGVGTSKI